MAKSAKQLAKKDQHKSGFMVRLPEDYRAAINKLVAKTHRKMTVEVQLALIEHFKANDIAPLPAVQS